MDFYILDRFFTIGYKTIIRYATKVTCTESNDT